MREKNFKTLTYIFIILTIAFMLTNTGCSKKTEFKINGEWQQCQWIETVNCGETYRCGEILHTCQTNVESRSR